MGTTTRTLEVGDRVLGYSHPSPYFHLAEVSSVIGDDALTARLMCGKACTGVAPRAPWRGGDDVCRTCTKVDLSGTCDCGGLHATDPTDGARTCQRCGLVD